MQSIKIYQGLIQSYTSATTCNVMVVPENYIFADSRLTCTLKDQTKPQVGSVVLVGTYDGYKSFIFSVLREPFSAVNNPSSAVLNNVGGMRAASDDTANFLKPGEIYMESSGTGPIPGLGASLYIGNAGTISLHSGMRQEYLTIGGRADDEDHEVILNGDNGFFQSNVNIATNIRSSINFDDLNNIQVGNNFVVSTSPVVIEQPINELTFDSFGNIVLRNTNLGATKGKLTFDALGNIVLESVTGTSVKITSDLGTVGVTGLTVKLNNGSLPAKGVARLNDIVTSDVTTDAAWWTFWSTLSALIAALPVSAGDGGATLKAGLAGLFASIPETQASKIITASVTVSAGD